jgi:hypothetical protein
MWLFTNRVGQLIRQMVVALIIGILGINLSLSAPTSEVQSLTIAFLYNFMKLSEWPTETTGNTLTLCVTEDREFGQELDTIDGKPIQDKTIAVKRLVLGDNPNECQLLFLPSEEKPIRLQEWLRLAATKPILTVSDMPGFLDQGGMINLVSEDNRLQFEVNLLLVEKTGITLSSQMLQIARLVRNK